MGASFGDMRGAGWSNGSSPGFNGNAASLSAGSFIRRTSSASCNSLASSSSSSDFEIGSSVLAGCTTRVTANACQSLFAAATGRDGKAPTDTLTAALSIARNAGFKPERIFALLDEFYPVPQGKHLRATPFMPYLSFAPGSWVLPLKFSGGGNAGGAKIMFDSEGNAGSGPEFLLVDGRGTTTCGPAICRSSVRMAGRFPR